MMKTHMMKKLFAAILALTALAALSASAETVTVDEALLGTWVMDDAGLEFTFNPDGTYVTCFTALDDLQGGGTYRTADGKIAFDGDAPQAYAIDGDTLTIQDEIPVTFVRKSAGGIDQGLIGTWVLQPGEDIPEGTELTLTFGEDGIVVLNINGVEDSGPYTVDGIQLVIGEGVTYDFIQAEDILILDDHNTLMTFNRQR